MDENIVVLDQVLVRLKQFGKCVVNDCYKVVQPDIIVNPFTDYVIGSFKRTVNFGRACNGMHVALTVWGKELPEMN